MKLAEDEALHRLHRLDHGVLCTLSADRGVDAVPAVYAVHGRRLGVPIDEVKPKSSQRLQRLRNLEVDPRATLLIERWDHDDWSDLWWVRAELLWQSDAQDHELFGSILADRFHQYRDRPFSTMLVFEIGAVSGWSSATS